ncbi:MAG: hypothetical protein CVT83_00140 [Alphaproteobacteria bacterium HGW-Alphaproteobacteria-5]|nr:MAG: hypothetical protein CVT83_00140 [Alphaproteobacteria bacterium HGW-Alphaproteobacteria-5]
MTFAPLGNPSKLVETIGPDDPVFNFGNDGKSYYKAFELPRSDTSYALEVCNYTTHPGRGSYFRIFLPSFVFLNEAKEPTPDPTHQGPAYANGDEAFIQRYIQFLIKPDSTARYVVIYTSRESQLNGVMATYGRPGVAFAAGLFIPVGGQKAALKGSPEGKISVTLKEPAPATE